jgi:hypothetical protein
MIKKFAFKTFKDWQQVISGGSLFQVDGPRQLKSGTVRFVLDKLLSKTWPIAPRSCLKADDGSQLT